MIQNREKRYLIAGLLITITFLATFTSVVPKAEALKPKDHFTLASQVLNDLETPGMQGCVQIGSLLYKPNSLVADAVSRYPSYYKMGCIGPDAFPDIIFGQDIVHPDHVGDNTNVYPDHYFGDGKSWSSDWLNALLTNAVNTAELGRKYSSTPWGSSTLDLGKRIS